MTPLICIKSLKSEVAAGSGVSFRPCDTAIVFLAVSEVVVQVAFIGRALTTQTQSVQAPKHRADYRS